MGEPMVWEWRTPDDNFGAIVFDLHASAAAVALLAAPKLVIYGVERDGYSGGKPREGGHQALAMRLPGGFKSQHSPRIFMVTEARSAPHRYISRRPSKIDCRGFGAWSADGG